MAFIEKLAARLLARSSGSAVMDIEVRRQNTPPDEVDAELAEAMDGQEFVLPQREAVKVRTKAAGS